MRPHLFRDTLVALVALAAPAAAHDPTGAYDAWLAAQRNRASWYCCDGHDAVFLEPGDWGIEGGRYWVRLGGEKRPLDDFMSLDPKGGPNPTGRAVLWVTGGGSVLRCFTPAAEG